MKKIIIISLILLIPFLAKAVTVEDLMAQIAELQNQILNLQRQLHPEQYSFTCHTFTRNLAIGSTGSEVKYLHIVLEKQGFIISPYEKQNSYFQYSTSSAVSRFQEVYPVEILRPLGLKSGTGFVGLGTRNKLNELYGCSATETPTPTEDYDPASPKCDNGYCETNENIYNCPEDCKDNSVTCKYHDDVCVDLNGANANAACENYCQSINKTSLYASYSSSQFSECSIGAGKGICCMCKDIEKPLSCVPEGQRGVSSYTDGHCCSGLVLDSLGGLCKKPVTCASKNQQLTVGQSCCSGLKAVNNVCQSIATCSASGVSPTASMPCCSGLVEVSNVCRSTIGCTSEGNMPTSLKPCCSGLKIVLSGVIQVCKPITTACTPIGKTPSSLPCCSGLTATRIAIGDVSMVLCR